MVRLPWYLFFTYWTFILTIVLYIFPLHDRITTLPLNLICSIGVADIFITKIVEFQLYSFGMHIMPFTIVKKDVILNTESLIFCICFILAYLLFLHIWCKTTVFDVYKTYMSRKYETFAEVMNERFRY